MTTKACSSRGRMVRLRWRCRRLRLAWRHQALPVLLVSTWLLATRRHRRPRPLEMATPRHRRHQALPVRSVPSVARAQGQIRTSVILLTAGELQ